MLLLCWWCCGLCRGYNIGVRLVDEFLAKANIGACESFRETAEVIAKASRRSQMRVCGPRFGGLGLDLTDLPGRTRCKSGVSAFSCVGTFVLLLHLFLLLLLLFVHVLLVHMLVLLLLHFLLILSCCCCCWNFSSTAFI